MKIFRIALRSILYIVLAVLFIVGLAALALQFSTVQTWAVGKVTQSLEKSLGTDVRVGAVDIDFFKTLVLEDIYLEDQSQDTLAYAGRVGAEIGVLDLLGGEIYFDLVELADARIKLVSEDSTFNFQYLIDSLAAPPSPADTAALAFTVGFDRVEVRRVLFSLADRDLQTEITSYIDELDLKVDEFDLENQVYGLHAAELSGSAFRYLDANAPPAPAGAIDYGNIVLRDVSFELEALRFVTDSTLLQLQLSALSATEQSGLQLRNLEAKVYFSPQKLALDALQLTTAQTDVQGEVLLTYDSLEQLSVAPGEVEVYIDLAPSQLALTDLAYLAPDLSTQLDVEQLGNLIQLRGAVQGTLGDLRGTGFRLETGSNTVLDADFRIRGLPESTNPQLSLDVRQLATNADDLRALKAAELPPELLKLGQINFTGTYEGDLLGGRLDGQLNSALGSLTANVDARFNESYTDATYRGNLQLNQFDVGTLIGNDSLGPLTLNVNLDGRGLDPTQLSGRVDATLSDFRYGGYTFEDLRLDGRIDRQQFTGQLEIDDPNLRFAFDGFASLNDSLPQFDFTAALDTLNLHKLGFSPDTLGLRADISANFRGQTADDFRGELRIADLSLHNGRETYREDSMVLRAYDSAQIQLLTFRSDIVRFDLRGDYNFATLPVLVRNYINDYFPVDELLDTVDTPTRLAMEPGGPPPPADQSFAFNLLATELTRLTRLFVPDLETLDTLSVAAQFDSRAKDLGVEIRAPLIGFAGGVYDDLVVTADGDAAQILYDIALDTLAPSPQQVFLAPSVTGRLGDQRADLAFSLPGRDTAQVDSLNKLVELSIQGEKAGSYYRFKLGQDLILNGLAWNINPEHGLYLQQEDAYVEDLRINRGNETIRISSEEAPRPYPPITVQFFNLSVETLSDLANYEGYDLSGRIDGEVNVRDYTTNYYVTTDLRLDSLSLNSDPIGNLRVEATQRAADRVSVDIRMSGRNELTVEGNYDIETTGLALDADLQRLDLSIVEPFLDEFAKNTAGVVKGKLDIDGTTTQPDIAGTLQLLDVATTVVYIGQRITVEDARLTFRGDQLIFEDFVLRDTLDDEATLSGRVSFADLANPRLDLRFRTDRFPAVNAAEGANPFFYGKLFVEADIDIEGPTSDLSVVGRATALNGTNFVALQPEVNVSATQASYIVYVDYDTLTRVPDDSVGAFANRKRDLEITAEVAYNLELNLEIDPEAVFTFVIDPLNDDRVTVRGRGLLEVELNEAGDISLLGSVTVVEGKYYFSYENLVRKEFIVESGSRIDFRGDPLEALLNIDAAYETETNPYELIANQIVGDPTFDQIKRQLVRVELSIGGQIMSPVLKFDIRVPDNSGDIGDALAQKLAQLREEESELYKQVFSLLLFNSFITEQRGGGGLSEAGESVAVSSVSNLITSQLNKFADRLIQGVELTFNIDSYRASPLVGSDAAETVTELEVGLRKQLFNERLTLQVGSNFGVTGRSYTQTSTNSFTAITSDFVLMYRLTESGRWNLRVFRQSDFDILNDQSINRTGAGVTFRRKF